jgi:hypothetical protein
MNFSIFYAWQSDAPSAINKDFIQDAVQLAINNITATGDIELVPALDRDTEGVPGSPSIAETIFEKIEKCGLFLCDVTIMKESAQRRTPNPNVLIELGYAAAKIGWHRVIFVMNVEYGAASKLPFDLRHRRWPIQYKLAQNSSEQLINETRNRLSTELEGAIRDAIKSGVINKDINPKDKRVAARFENALVVFVGTLSAFLRAVGHDDAILKVDECEINEDTGYPNIERVQPIIEVLQTSVLSEPSFRSVGDNVLPWWQVFVHDLMETANECKEILDQYADRDDELIGLIEEIRNRASNLSSILSTCMTTHLSELYKNGVPDVHIDFFRHFLLAILKSYRVIKKFKTD